MPVKLSNSYLRTLDIMLIRNDPGFNFATAPWPVAKTAYPFIGSDVDDATGEQRYDDLLERKSPSPAFSTSAKP